MTWGQAGEWVPVSSSNLAAVRYHSPNLLDIRFHNGRSYRYFGVPQSVYDGLLEAPSKRKYHHANIKRSFPYSKI